MSASCLSWAASARFAYNNASETNLAVRDDIRAILPVQQSIRETQSTLLAQQTTLTTLVEDSVAQSMIEAHATREGFQASTRGLATTTDIHTSIQGLATKTDVQQIKTDIQQANYLLERLQILLEPSQGNAVPRVVDINDDGSTQPKNERILENDLAASIRSIIQAIQNREGVFALDKAREISDALLDFLARVLSSGKLLNSKATSGARGRKDQYDVEALQANLKAVQGAILMSRQIVVNKNGEWQCKVSEQ